jgi:hypothetical protein
VDEVSGKPSPNTSRGRDSGRKQRTYVKNRRFQTGSAKVYGL